jgi:uncharacterized protein (TIGR03437 family)
MNHVIIVPLLVGMAIISPAQTFVTLVSFDGANGASPLYGSLVLGADGDFYGTTSLGGSNDLGTIFKMTRAGALVTLHSFNGTDGALPSAGPIQAADGNFYGTTTEGGAHNDGTVFRMTPGGALTTLHSFNGADGALPYAGPIQATDGNFYGTTTAGGANNDGTVFKITAAGALTTLHSFARGPDGAHPEGTLVQGANGTLYGTASAGGLANQGTVFEIALVGTFAALHTFDLADGSAPSAGLIRATDGNFYGTTQGGGANLFGTIFKITPGGALTSLHSFDLTDGATPSAGLIQGSDGNFYGTTQGGGVNLYGTIFEITTGGALTTLYNFAAGTDGSDPDGALSEGSNGSFYGTAHTGGVNGDGIVFMLRLTPDPSQAPAITLVANAEGGSATIAPNTWVSIKGSNLAPVGDSRTWRAPDFVNGQLPAQLDGVAVTMNGESAYLYYISPTQLNVLTPPDLAPGPVEVTVTTGGVTSASFTAQARPESPSFFVFGAYVIGTHLNGTDLSPTTPAQPGEVVILYANGFGPVSPPVAAGSEVQSGSLPALPAIQIGGMPAVVQFAGLVSPGLYQFNVVVPASAPSGDDAITATYNGLSTQAGAMLTVQP